MSKVQISPIAPPHLRFPEFLSGDGWVSKKLSQLSIFVKERAGTADCTPYTVTTGVGLLSQQEKFGRTIAGESLKNYLVLQRNDFAYNKSSTKAFPQGYIARYVDDKRAAVPNSIFTCFRVNNQIIDPPYLDYLFTSNLHGNWLRNFITIGARAHGSLVVNDNDLMALPVPLPDGSSSLAEQRKIAECLTSLDEVIAAQGRKVVALKAHKRGLIQQLFPREGETVPRIRFPEFGNAAEWVQMTLDQIVEFQSGGTPSKANPGFWNGEIPWVSAKDMKQLFLYDSEDHITTAAVDDGAKLVPAGALLMLTRGMTLLKDVPICVLRREMSFNQDVKALRPKENLAGLFLAYLLLGNKQRLLKMVDVAGHGTGKLNTDELKALDLSIPSTEKEQQRIADCFSLLDSQITAASEKLAALKIHKKGLMQQLFPSSGASQQHAAAAPSRKPFKVGFARQLLAAEILLHCHKERTMGRVKLQKLIHLCEYHSELDDIHGNYARAAAGPFDNKLMRGIANGLEKQNWFKEIRDEKRTSYEPMEASGQHSKYLAQWSQHLPKIRKVVRLFTTAKTLSCEIASTLYAAWNDLLIDGRHPTDEEIIREASDPRRWHESKAAIEKSKWPTALRWMREKGLVPRGYGAHTTKPNG